MALEFKQNIDARKAILSKVYFALQKTKQKKPTNPTDAIEHDTQNHNDLFQFGKETLELEFAKAFHNIGGNFIYCADEADCFKKLKQLIKNKTWNKIYCGEEKLRRHLEIAKLNDLLFSDLYHADIAITSCDLLIARTGSIAISTAGSGDRVSNVFAPIHICIAYHHQVVNNLDAAITHFKNKRKGTRVEYPSMLSIITGPSKTADIEKTLVKGVHGPEEIFVFFIDEN